MRLRSFVPGALARVVVKPTTGGGHVRLQASRMPEPWRVAPGARAFVVWATGGGVRWLGELRRDARGNAAFEFAHPAEFERYSLVVTAEADAAAPRPIGAPIFSTHAGEVSALYTTQTGPHQPTAAGRGAARAPLRVNEAARARAVTPRPGALARAVAGSVLHAPRTGETAAPSSPTAEFYESINEAVADPVRSHTLMLIGDRGAARARGEARVATRAGTAYVRVRFRRVPPPVRFGARKYVMWAVTPKDDPYFLRALPARRLNRRPTYARRPNFNSEEFRLLVTAERSYPAPQPRGRRVLHTKE